MSVTVYGIRNCDNMKKVFAWLDEHKIDYAFHDYRKDGISRDKVEGWVRRAGWDQVINRSGLTYRGLPEPEKQAMDEARAIELMLEKPSSIRRPVIEADGDKLIIGFSNDGMSANFEK